MFDIRVKTSITTLEQTLKGGSKCEIGGDMSPIINKKSIIKIFMAIRENLIYKPIQNWQIYKNRYILLR